MVSVVGSYRLPANYAMMVSRRDIVVVNSHLHRFTLTRMVKHSGICWLPFDDKPYTWELVLKRLPQETIMAGGTAFLSVIYIYIVVVCLFKCHIFLLL